MSRVRPFAAADLAQVAALHQRLFAEGSHLTLEQRRRYLDQVFLKNPWSDGDASPSLVCETADGRLVGFLGVLRRPMSWNGQPITAAVISQFMVEPQHRGLTGFRLLATFLAGPQELSMTDGASQEAVKLWKAMGGVESPLHSLHWTRLLRPLTYGLAVLGPRVPAAPLVRPLGSAVDAMLARLRRNPFRVAPQGPDEELSVDGFLEHEHHCIPRGGLRPEYDRSSLKWLLEMAEQKGSLGRLRGSLVHNAEREVIGWYLHYVRRGVGSEVLQVAGRDERLGEVLDHLFADAWRQGALAVSGRLQPRLFEALRSKHCLFHDRGSPLIVYSRRRELIDAIRSGQAPLTRLDGEWWMPFQDVR
jgi:hypothetical protein